MRVGCLILSILFVSLCAIASESVIYTTDLDKQRFGQYIDYIQTKERTPQAVLMATADFFLTVPYVASTLEKEPEGLVVNLRELDCTTFVETVLSLSKTVLDGEPTFESFCINLQLFRYRHGIIDGYTSRLHYTTDWIYDNSLKGLIKDITQQIGGEALPVSVSFMSENPDKYKSLKGDSLRIEKMATIEQSINKRSYYYILKERIDALRNGIQEGDMIAFVTSIKGLDVSHVGLAKWKDGELTFIHASSSHKKVIVEPRTLHQYAEAIKSNKGIIVVRPVFSEN